MRSGRLLSCLLTGGITMGWFTATGMLVLNRHRFQRLSRIALQPSERDTLPTLSVLVPACNEAATLEQAMQSLLAMDYPCMEIIAVNDRSTDGTGALLERLAAENPRLRVRHVVELPAGWLGKNHALHVASQEATGDWLLFTDADVVYSPDALLRAVSYARRVGADHLVGSGMSPIPAAPPISGLERSIWSALPPIVPSADTARWRWKSPTTPNSAKSSSGTVFVRNWSMAAICCPYAGSSASEG